MSRAAPDFSSALRFIHDPGAGSLAPISVPAGCVSPSTGLNMTASGALFGHLDAVDFQSFRYGRWAADGSFLGLFDLPAGTTGVRVNDRGQGGLRALGRPSTPTAWR